MRKSLILHSRTRELLARYVGTNDRLRRAMENASRDRQGAIAAYDSVHELIQDFREEASAPRFQECFEDALDHLSDHKATIILDLTQGDLDALAGLRGIRQINRCAPVLILGQASLWLMSQVMLEGAEDYITDDNDLCNRVIEILAEHGRRLDRWKNLARTFAESSQQPCLKRNESAPFSQFASQASRPAVRNVRAIAAP